MSSTRSIVSSMRNYFTNMIAGMPRYGLLNLAFIELRRRSGSR